MLFGCGEQRDTDLSDVVLSLLQSYLSSMPIPIYLYTYSFDLQLQIVSTKKKCIGEKFKK